MLRRVFNKIERLRTYRQLIGVKGKPQLPRVASRVLLLTPRQLKKLGNRAEKKS
jgi:hypothetical protein